MQKGEGDGGESSGEEFGREDEGCEDVPGRGGEDGCAGKCGRDIFDEGAEGEHKGKAAIING